MNIEERLQVLDDIFQISELKTRYCDLSDSGWGGLSSNADAIGELFVEDGIYDAGAFGVAKGRDKIRRLLGNARIKLIFHHIGNPLIKVDGDSATGQWHGLVSFVGENDESNWLGLVYGDEFARTPEGWRLKKLTSRPAFLSKNGQGFKAL